MTKLDFSKCQYNWIQDYIIPDETKEAIMEEVRSLSLEIEEALGYTKKLTKPSEIRIYLDVKDSAGESPYFISIFCDTGDYSWNISIGNMRSDRTLGEVEFEDLDSFSLI